jgi:hypothetical protein
MAFGNQLTNIASVPKSVTLINTGTVALPIASITLSTPSPQPFSQTNTCGTSVAVGATCTINVVFNPTSAGSTMATLSVNVGNGIAAQTVALSGSGIVPSYQLSPSSVAFGNQLTNIASVPKSVTLINTGTVALPIASITLSTPGPQPFSQTNTCGTSVAVGATCTINVVFNPTSAGSTMATLSVNVAGKTSTVNVSGNGSFNVILKASSQSVTVSVPVTLTWSSTKGATCTPSGGTTADNWTGTIGASGSHLITEASAGTYDYGLICVAQAVSATATVTVAMTLPAVTLTATPIAITVGKPVALTWTSSNAPACAASGGQSADGWTGARSANGTASVTPNAAGTIMYVMTCSSGPKSAQSVAQVVSTGPPGSSGGGGALDEFSLLCILALIGLHAGRSGTRRHRDRAPRFTPTC